MCLPTAPVFDLQRCSMHDGPGIRTTVFLKGCPLRCLWCHNPESQRTVPELLFYEHRCTGCGICEDVCPRGVSRDAPPSERAVSCKVCGSCASLCPNNALVLKGRMTGIDELMAVIRRDKVFYERSSGGLTISGGEPLAHPEFLAALLQTAVREGIHTCVETCGYAPWEHIERILPNVNLFLFDWKASNPDRHRELTGVDNKRILENLARLFEAGAQVLFRCPLVPGVNDDPEHLHSIGQLPERYPKCRGVEVLPWHNMGVGKREALGLPPQLADLPTVSEEQKHIWLDWWRSRGYDRVEIL